MLGLSVPDSFLAWPSFCLLNFILCNMWAVRMCVVLGKREQGLSISVGMCVGCSVMVEACCVPSRGMCVQRLIEIK